MTSPGGNGLTQRHRGTEAQREADEGGKNETRYWMAVICLLAIAGVMLGWNKGRLPVREAAPDAVVMNGIAPDLALYREVIAEVKAGRGYYEVAREKIPEYGFPIASPLNWRLPTYAWVFSKLPNKCWIQAVLLLLALGGMGMTFVAHRRASGVALAAMTTFLMFGVVRWTFDGLAYLAQEPWAAVLMLVSLAAGAVATTDGEAEGRRHGGTARQRWAWRAVSVGTGILALLFRELALPYCLVAGGMATWKRRWGEAVGWLLGIAMFFGLFVWHVGQVKAQLLGAEVAAGAGLAQWLRFGGLDFVLLTTRMNSLLFGAPGWLLWLYLLVALVGLSRGRNESSQVACLAALMYLLAFAVVGRPENFYWGLMPAPLLAWGAAGGVVDLCRSARELVTGLKPVARTGMENATG